MKDVFLYATPLDCPSTILWARLSPETRSTAWANPSARLGRRCQSLLGSESVWEDDSCLQLIHFRCIYLHCSQIRLLGTDCQYWNFRDKCANPHLSFRDLASKAHSKAQNCDAARSTARERVSPSFSKPPFRIAIFFLNGQRNSWLLNPLNFGPTYHATTYVVPVWADNNKYKPDTQLRNTKPASCDYRRYITGLRSTSKEESFCYWGLLCICRLGMMNLDCLVHARCANLHHRLDVSFKLS